VGRQARAGLAAAIRGVKPVPKIRITIPRNLCYEVAASHRSLRMTRSSDSETASAPPSFEEAKNRRQKTRACGLDPDYWYAVALSKNLKPGKAQEVVFWKRSFAIFRGTDGKVRAVENRCAHRQLKLSEGDVVGCQLRCAYHGWTYEGDGRLADIPHPTFGHGLLKLKIGSFPVVERYGLIWLFPGDPAQAETRRLPEIPTLEGPDRWACEPLEFLWHGHHSMIMDNVSDFTHGHLHRKFEPFSPNWQLTRVEREGDKVWLEQAYEMASGKLIKWFVDKPRAGKNQMVACYEYPYHWSKTDDFVRHWMFVLPLDERTTRVFFLFHYERLKLPVVPVRMPRLVMDPVVKYMTHLIVEPLLAQDGVAVALEQEGYEAHWDKPIAEVSPVVKAFQDLTIEKWEAHLARQNEARRTIA
jgi:phenylpropionate dioxygenase-like ring-hydroxylating dioxygenase large terminal subunit